MAARRRRPIQMTAQVEGIDRVRRSLARIDPARRTRITRDALVESGLLVAKVAAEQKIKRGGRAAPLPDRLTSRTGTGRRSIRVDRGPLPKAIEIGTDLVYMAAHEVGGTFSVPAHSRVSSTGTRYRVRGYALRLPARPFLAPAFDDSKSRIRDIFLRRWGREVRAVS